MTRKTFGIVLVLFFALAWMSLSSMAGFLFLQRERVWVPCDFGVQGECAVGNPEQCFPLPCK